MRHLELMAATVWRGRLAFGLVSIPVRLYKAARRERIRFHHVYRPASEPPEAAIEAPAAPIEEPPPPRGKVQEFPRPAPAATIPAMETVARVRNLPVAEQTEAPVEKSQVLKAFEIEKDRFVTFEPREVAAIRPETSTELAISEFVRLSEIDPIYFETSYYAVPDRGGEKPYALLFAAMKQTGYAAIGSLAMHGREHAAVIRPGSRGLILHTLFYQNEVRADEEHPTDTAQVNAKELELAGKVIQAMASRLEPERLKDTFEERLRALIESRAGQAVAAYEHGEVTRKAPVVDIMEALRKTMEMARKPPASERTPQPKPAKSRRQKSRA